MEKVNKTSATKKVIATVISSVPENIMCFLKSENMREENNEINLLLKKT